MELSARFLAFTTYGVQWVLWLLIALSVVSIAMMLERLWHFATYRPNPQLLAREIRELLELGAALRGSSSGVTSVESLEAAGEGAKVGERLRLERNLAFLGTLGSNAPFIGLFGTVLGIIKAFHDLAGNQAGGPAVVMAGISEALVATAVGLMVAIPAVVAFNYFNRRVRTIMTQVDWMAHLALAELKASEAVAAASGAAVAASLPAAAPRPVYPLRRLVPFAVLGGLAIVSGLLVRQRMQPVPRTLIEPAPHPPAPPEPHPVVIPHLPPELREEPESPLTPATMPAAAGPVQSLATPMAPTVDPVPSAATPKAPATTPKAPVGTPKAPVATPKAPVGTPKAPVATPNRPVASPTRPVAAPAQPGAPKPVRFWKGKKKKGPATPAAPAAEGSAAPKTPEPEAAAPAVP